MKAQFFLLAALTVLLTLGATPSLDAQEKHLLRQRWEPGKAYYLESNTDMQMDVPGLPGGGQNTNLIQFMDIIVRKEPKTDRKLLDLKITAIKALMNIGGKPMTFDSNDPAMSEPMLQQAFGALLGKSVTLIYDKDDKFQDVIIPEGFMPTPLGAGLGPDAKQLGAMFRESIDYGLPATPIGVGSTFTHERNMDMKPMAALTIKLNGKFDSIVDHEGRKHAKVTLDGTMDGAKPPGEGQELVSLLPGSKLSVETLFDIDRKVVTRNTVKSELKMSAGGREMGMKQNMTTTLKKIGDVPPESKDAK
jgi:hypothetical protein